MADHQHGAESAVAGSAGRAHALSLIDIVQRFGPVTAVDHISLEIAPGELVALLGPSGCGKTTLLRVIAGFLSQTSGEVLVDGQSLSHLSPNQRGVGIVFQNYALFPHMTVAENVRYGLEARRRPRAESDEIAARNLALVQMSDFGDRFPRQLSGGQQQRVALARCLAVEPKILLLDEPFGALDKNLRLDMQIEIKNIQRQSGITTILVTHDQEEAMTMADRIAVLNRGKVEQFATPTEIYDRPATLFVNSFVGTSSLLPGELTEKNGTRCRVALDAGAELVCEAATDCAPGERVLLSVRPERLHFAEPGHDQSVAAIVRAVMPLGPSTVFDVVARDGTAVKVVEDRAATAPALRAGQPCALRLAAADACAIFRQPTS